MDPIDCDRHLAEDFFPLTRSERLVRATKSVIGPSVFLRVGLQAALLQLNGQPDEWGGGAKGFRKRFVMSYAGRFIGQSVEQGIAFARHEDNRYFLSGEEGFGRRLKYAVTSTFLTRHDDGRRGFSYSAVGGAAAGSFISRPLHPPRSGSAADGAVAFGLTLAIRTGFNVAREFTPRFFGRFL